MQENNSSIKIITFGCRLNTYESEVMRKHASDAGLKNLVIVNTCAVTGEAERQARQAIRKARRDNPNSRIVVTGCGAQTNTETFAEMPEVDNIIGNDIKLKPEPWLELHEERIQIHDIMETTETFSYMITGFEGRDRAFVQVQNGCNHRCTFCIIPFGRGNSRSVSVEDIIEQCKRLVEGGYREIVLTGVDITSYGQDLPENPSLGFMVKKVLQEVKGIERLRLSSLDPSEIDADLWEVIKKDMRFMPHLHLSMQSGDDMILKRMKRRHSSKDIIDVCNKARSLRPNMVFGADIIAGFPTETDEMFQNSYDLIKKCNITFLHIFPYSARKGTPAAKMPQVKGDIRKNRAKLLRDLGDINLQNHLQSLEGCSLKVLVESNRKARTEYFSEVVINKDVEAGTVVNVDIVSVGKGYLEGRVL